MIEKLQTLIECDVWDENVALVNGEIMDFDFLLALGAKRKLQLSVADAHSLDFFASWHQSTEWTFGIWGYELKNSIENLTASKENPGEFPALTFFQPLTVIGIKGKEWTILKNESPFDQQRITDLINSATPSSAKPFDAIELEPKMDRETYLADVRALIEHIQQGDIYEVNYCQEFFAKKKIKQPYRLFTELYKKTTPPHAAYVQSGNTFLVCASPERYIAKKGQHVFSQPIKGTIKRGANKEEDALLKEELTNSQKEKSENVMIVDLVRNDLSKSAVKGSVKVDELFGIKSFKTVHHMVSTVSAELKEHTPFHQLLRDTFPMGSMTGAPKVRAMELIDEYEKFNRSWYSGSVGYIAPNGDADFNVIIRSLLINNKKSYVSLGVGSAITAQCSPEKEYDECLLKAAAIRRVLSGK